MNTITDEPGVLDTDLVLVRTMTPDDLGRVVDIDAASSKRRRPRYFELMIERAMKQSPLQISLVAELDGRAVGFLIASLFYGEYGIVEPSASIEAVGVEPPSRGKNVGKALMRQMRMNLGSLGVTSLRTEVAWHDAELLAFFRSEGFAPAARLCLEAPLDPTRI